MRSCLITGGAGFIGSHLVDACTDLGWSVDIVDDFSSGDIKNIRERNISDLDIGDFTYEPVLQKVRDGKYDTVFHLAARPRVSYSVEHPAETNNNNVQKTLVLMEAIKSSPKKTRFVFSSSSSVYGGADVLPTPASHPHNPKSPYAFQKSIIEQYCRMFGSLYSMESVCLRYFNVFGPRAKGNGAYATAVSAWIHAIKSGTPLRSDGDGSQTRDMCHVSNVVQANILAAESDELFRGEAFNVACGDRVSNRDVLEYLKRHYKGITVQDAPWRPGDVMHTQADISETQKVLGYDPKVKFWHGLEMTLKEEGL